MVNLNYSTYIFSVGEWLPFPIIQYCILSFTLPWEVDNCKHPKTFNIGGDNRLFTLMTDFQLYIKSLKEKKTRAICRWNDTNSVGFCCVQVMVI